MLVLFVAKMSIVNIIKRKWNVETETVLLMTKQGKPEMISESDNE